MERKDIDLKYKWDDKRLFENLSDCKSEFINIKRLADMVMSCKDKLNNKKGLLEYYLNSRKLSKLSSKVGVYLFLRQSVEGDNAEIIEVQNMYENLSLEISQKLSCFNSLLSALSNDYLNDVVSDVQFEDFSRSILNIIRNKPHVLSEKEEKLLVGAGSYCDNSEIFDTLETSELKFEDINCNGTQFKLDPNNYSKYIFSDDRDVRMQAYDNLLKGYMSVNKTLAVNYLASLKADRFFAVSRNFKDVFSANMFEDEIDESIYSTLTDNIDNNLPIIFKYFKVKQKMLGLNSLKIYDIYGTIKSKNDFKPDIETSIEIVKNAMKPLGEEYIKLINKAQVERWIDFLPCFGKNSGGFCISTGTAVPFILVNHQENYEEISTLAHELGHAMHAYLAETTQCYEKSEQEIFTAEIASTVNEVLLSLYLINKETDKTEKLILIDNLIFKFYATVIRQTMFSEFEKTICEKLENNEPLSYDVFNTIYGELLTKYFGSKDMQTEYSKYEWSRISHFYSSFYVFKYATGFISAIIIASKLLKDNSFASNYLQFLKSGNSNDALSLLKNIGIDLSCSQAYDEAFEFIINLINEMEQLI
ncbi:MAG: oligoendopeptidase F [Clostridia bacterium]